MSISDIYYSSLTSIHFSERFKTIVDLHNNDKNYLSTTKKTEVLSIFKSFGYNFKYIDRAFILEEIFMDIKIQVTMIIKGSVLCYFYVWYHDELIDVIFGHFTHIRNRLEGIEEFIAPTFQDYQELKIIIGEFIGIYEDFIKEFIKEVDESLAE